MRNASAKGLEMKTPFNNNLFTQTGEVIVNPINPDNPDSKRHETVKGYKWLSLSNQGRYLSSYKAFYAWFKKGIGGKYYMANCRGKDDACISSTNPVNPLGNSLSYNYSSEYIWLYTWLSIFYTLINNCIKKPLLFLQKAAFDVFCQE